MGSKLLWLLLLFCCTLIANGEYMKYKDPKQPLNVRIKDLVGRMTLEEKIGQMAQIEKTVASADVLNKYFIGSILSGAGSAPGPLATPEAWVNMVNGFQKGALSTRLGIPMIYGIDAVHGHGNVYKATIFPHNVGLGATRDPELVKRIGAATALEVRATGIPYVFGPCIAVCRDPRWGRCYESFSEDPDLVQEMTRIIPGLQGDIPPTNPKACAKHYVGDGGTNRGINENNTVIDWNGLLRIHMRGYLNAVKDGVATVMVSYSSLNGVKMHANYDLITGFLKNTLKFRGFVISDYQGIDKITNPPFTNYSYSVLTSINAGIDMVMIGFEYTKFIDDLTFHVKNKNIPMSRIDDAVKRILRVKFQMGLFESPLGDTSLVSQVGSHEHRELAREAVRKSLVLLKNGKKEGEAMLPLPKKASRVLVAGTTILEAIRNTVDQSTEVIYNENPDTRFLSSNKFSYAIVVVGEPPYAEGFGDSNNLTIPEPGPSIMKGVCGAVKCVVVVISGRPVVVEPYLEGVEALVAAWLPGTQGQGVADVLYGEYGFTGKLPRTWFRRLDQLPMNVGDPHYDPLFAFGFGLTTQPLS
ncbi:hypothetical protein V2J09_018629 [Rumex salicifolius]